MVGLRDRLAEEIDATDSPHNLERMAARLQSVMAEIAELAPVSESEAVDEVLKRRQERRRNDQAVAMNHAEARGGAGMTHG